MKDNDIVVGSMMIELFKYYERMYEQEIIRRNLARETLETDSERPIDIVEAEIRFRETKSGGSSTWEVYNYILFSDGSVYQPTICFKDSQSAAMKVVEEIYNYPVCD